MVNVVGYTRRCNPNFSFKGLRALVLRKWYKKTFALSDWRYLCSLWKLVVHQSVVVPNGVSYAPLLADLFFTHMIHNLIKDMSTWRTEIPSCCLKLDIEAIIYYLLLLPFVHTLHELEIKKYHRVWFTCFIFRYLTNQHH